jgi:hypothetical protein
MKNERDKKQWGTCISFPGDLSSCPPETRVCQVAINLTHKYQVATEDFTV